ncbi:hypothetical protein PSE10C_32600 [Pseudomonas amygdali pv. eriobotryae]|uniref:Uncharacterized protein n=1 Tax=Pseudomonas amygdali pv. eriobotryae TaxID=129137 RepID=A0A9P3AHD2_PSEA0|nr:hypothetical protein PSE10A_44780 [Pseudomonas amygdali pv. eriobotryae]GFZ72518.1 hypothetical protein PSE10C_32600 [Pseudomonas amygdali pv. eriobotryae]
MDRLLLRCECLGSGRNASTLELQLGDPAAQLALTHVEGSGCLGATVTLVKHQAGSLTLEGGG